MNTLANYIHVLKKHSKGDVRVREPVAEIESLKRIRKNLISEGYATGHPDIINFSEDGFDRKEWAEFNLTIKGELFLDDLEEKKNNRTIRKHLPALVLGLLLAISGNLGIKATDFLFKNLLVSSAFETSPVETGYGGAQGLWKSQDGTKEISISILGSDAVAIFKGNVPQGYEVNGAVLKGTFVFPKFALEDDTGYSWFLEIVDGKLLDSRGGSARDPHYTFNKVLHDSNKQEQ